MQVKMEGCEAVWFKHCAVTEFLTMEKIPLINIHHCMQAVYRDKCVDVSTDVSYGSSSKKGDKQDCITQHDQGGKWLQQMSLIKNAFKILFMNIIESNNLESL